MQPGDGGPGHAGDRGEVAADQHPSISLQGNCAHGGCVAQRGCGEACIDGALDVVASEARESIRPGSAQNFSVRLNDEHLPFVIRVRAGGQVGVESGVEDTSAVQSDEVAPGDAIYGLERAGNQHLATRQRRDRVDR